MSSSHRPTILFPRCQAGATAASLSRDGPSSISIIMICIRRRSPSWNAGTTAIADVRAMLARKLITLTSAQAFRSHRTSADSLSRSRSEGVSCRSGCPYRGTRGRWEWRMMDWTALSNYPGAELVCRDCVMLLPVGSRSAPCLVSIARPLMEGSGLAKTLQRSPTLLSPSIPLYRLLQEQRQRCLYSRYNSLLRRLVSFERALRQAQSRS